MNAWTHVYTIITPLFFDSVDNFSTRIAISALLGKRAFVTTIAKLLSAHICLFAKEARGSPSICHLSDFFVYIAGIEGSGLQDYKQRDYHVEI